MEPTDDQIRTHRLLTVVAPLYNEEESLGEFYSRTKAALEGIEHELVLVNDGSADSTLEQLQALAAQDQKIRIVDLSRNFGHQAALTAGLDQARGDVVVMIDADLQDPPELIGQMLDAWRSGADVVYMVRESRAGETRFKLWTARWFYKVLGKLTELDSPNAGDFRLLDRQALDALLAMPERNRFLRGMSTWIGFEQVAISYERDPRFGGETKYPLGRLLRLSFDAITSFSHVPLQLATLLGFMFSIAAFLAIPIAIGMKIAGEFVPGVASILIAALLLGGIQLITVGIIGEYLGRVYDEVKQRPLYIIRSVTAPHDGD